MAFLEIKGLSKSYRGGKAPVSVLENINLQIEKGEFVAIVGYSGAGKTTLISSGRSGTAAGVASCAAAFAA